MSTDFDAFCINCEDATADMRVLRAENAQLKNLCELAWGVIANASGGNWKLEPADWQEAAARWRDGYHALR